MYFRDFQRALPFCERLTRGRSRGFSMQGKDLAMNLNDVSSCCWGVILMELSVPD